MQHLTRIDKETERLVRDRQRYKERDISTDRER